MANFVMIFVVIIILILGVGGFFVYKNYIENLDKMSDARRVQIAMLDEESGIFVETNYTIYFPDTAIVHEEGQTSKVGYVLNSNPIPPNQTFEVYNVNHEGQNYYTQVDLSGVIELNRNITTKFVLFNPGSLNVSQDGELGSENPLDLFITNDGDFRLAAICLRWDIGIIIDNINELERISPPERLKNKVDKCWKIEKEFLKEKRNHQNLTISIPYSILSSSELIDDLTIKTYLLDYDIWHGNVNITEKNGSDVGAEDVEYIIS